MRKTALITGGSRGIGAAAVRRFRALGYDVAFCYRQSESQAKALVNETGALAWRADVGDRAAAKALVEKAEREFGRLDLLINNAGVEQFGLLSDLTDEEWDRLVSVNLSAPVYAIRAALPGMIRRKTGCILNVSSIWGLCGASCEAAYSAVKAGVIGLTRALAKELGPSGITVNCVAPGVIDTEMNRQLSQETKAALAEETPLERLGTPEDVAQAIWFLASPAGDFFTGQVLSPNGGYLI